MNLNLHSLARLGAQVRLAQLVAEMDSILREAGEDFAIQRLRRHIGNRRFQALSERLENLKNRYEQDLVNSAPSFGAGGRRTLRAGQRGRAVHLA